MHHAIVMDGHDPEHKVKSLTLMILMTGLNCLILSMTLDGIQGQEFLVSHYHI